MSNTPALGLWRPDPRLDLGLGYCYRCIQFMAINSLKGSGDPKKLAGFVPNFACTMAPWPLTPDLVLALPACFPCQIGEGPAGEPSGGLFVANGRIPGL